MSKIVFPDDTLEALVHIHLSELVKNKKHKQIEVPIRSLVRIFSANYKRIVRALDSLCKRGYITNLVKGSAEVQCFVPSGDKKSMTPSFIVKQEAKKGEQRCFTQLVEKALHQALRGLKNGGCFTQAIEGAVVNYDEQIFSSYIYIREKHKQVRSTRSERSERSVRSACTGIGVIGYEGLQGREGVGGRGEGAPHSAAFASATAQHAGEFQQENSSASSARESETSNTEIWTHRKRKPPVRLTADEQFELRASQINDLRILKFADLVRGFYRDTLSCPYWKFDPTKKGSRTCAQRTIQRCEDEHWDLEDFLRVQFECYKKMGRRPYLQQLYSSEALCRYHDWMRENGYTVEVEDERIALDPETRKQDLAIERRAKEETRLLAQAGLLREQFDRYLEPHLARFRAALEVKYAKRVFTHEELGLPVWFGMSEEKLRASAISTEVALERLRIERNWSARRSERARVMEMIRIEIETEKRSPTIPLNLDMRKLGIPEWLIEQHEKVCSGGGKRS